MNTFELLLRLGLAPAAYALTVGALFVGGGLAGLAIVRQLMGGRR